MILRNILGAAGVAFLASTAFAGTVILDTGTAAWTVTTPASSTFAAIAIGQTPNPVWVSATGSSQWVSYISNGGNTTNNPAPGNNEGTYLYTLTFTPGAGVGTFSFNYSGDNTGSIQFFQNNVAIGAAYNATGNATNNAFLSVSSGSITLNAAAGDVFKIVGTVTNLVQIPPSNANPTGFFFNGTTTTAAATPEPSTFGLLGLGAAALIGSRLRRK